MDQRWRVNLFTFHFLLFQWTALLGLVILIAHKPLIVPFEYFSIISFDDKKIFLFRKIDSLSYQFLVLFLEVTISSVVIKFCWVPLGHRFYQFQRQLYKISSLVDSILSERYSHNLLEIGIGSGLNILLISLELAHIKDLLMYCLRKNILNTNVVHNTTQQQMFVQNHSIQKNRRIFTFLLDEKLSKKTSDSFLCLFILILNTNKISFAILEFFVLNQLVEMLCRVC